MRMVIKKVKTDIQKVIDRTTIDNKLIEGAKTIKREVRKHIITAITAAFGFLIALSWRDAITVWMNSLVNRFNISHGWYQFVAALLVTIIGVIGIIIVSKFEEKPVDVEEKSES